MMNMMDIVEMFDRDTENFGAKVWNTKYVPVTDRSRMMMSAIIISIGNTLLFFMFVAGFVVMYYFFVLMGYWFCGDVLLVL